MPLYRPSELARAWNLHVRTVLGFVERGELVAFRTPGGHVRLRAEAVRAFAEGKGLRVPPAASGLRPEIVVVGALAKPAERALAKALDDRAVLRPADGPMAALVGAVARPPRLVVVPAGLKEVDAAGVLAALRDEPATRDVLRLAYGARTERARQELAGAGAHAVHGALEGRAIGEAVLALLGEHDGTAEAGARAT